MRGTLKINVNPPLRYFILQNYSIACVLFRGPALIEFFITEMLNMFNIIIMLLLNFGYLCS